MFGGIMSELKNSEDLEEYVLVSSMNAAAFFKSIDYKHEVFEGCRIDFSPFICKEIYRDLLNGLEINGPNMAQKHGLFAAIVPIKHPNGKVVISAELGVVFPFVRSSEEQKPTPPEKSS
jgi:hypothetical protein